MQLTIDVGRTVPRRRMVLPAILGGLPLIFIVLALLATSPAHSWDQALAQAGHDLTWDQINTLWRGSRFLAWLFGNDIVLTFAAVLTAGALWLRRWRIAVWLTASVIIAVFGNKVLKAEFHRFRPHFNPPLDGIGGYSFPSGHATAGATVATILVLLTISLTNRGPLRYALVTAWSVLGLAVAASRVFLGVHYPTDVLAGLCWGTFVTLVLWVLVVVAPHQDQRATITSAPSSGRSAAVVLNPAKVGDVETFKTRVRSVASGTGWGEPLWFETSVEDPGRGQTHAALAAGADLLIAAGGDGTVRAVCEEAARTGVPVAIVPHGTGNLLARNLDIPLNSRDALQVAYAGHDRAVDLMTCRTDAGTETIFLVMAGVGFDALIMSGVDPSLKQRVGWWAYVLAGMKALRYPGMKVKIVVDDQEPVRMKARTVVVGNVGSLQGGVPLMPEAEIDDGLLNVIVLAPRRVIGWLLIVWQVLTRAPADPRRLRRFAGQRVTLKTKKPVPMQLDGDPIGDGRKLVVEAHAGVLLVRVPNR